MNAMKQLAAALSLVAVLVTAGCQDQHPTGGGAIQGVDKDKAQDLNAERSRFEQMKDPPVTADTRYAAGQLAESQGNPDQAIRQYTEALKTDPKHTKSLYRLGVVYAQQKKFTEAADTWRRYIDVSGRAAVGYNNLALCYEQAGRTADAAAAYLKGLDADPKSEPLHVNYGMMLARHGKIDDAMAQLTTVLSPAAAHYDLGTVFERQGRIAEARMEYRLALQLDPALQDAKQRLAGAK
jgi:tetratricopeptide (TPR) repeat protein